MTRKGIQLETKMQQSCNFAAMFPNKGKILLLMTKSKNPEFFSTDFKDLFINMVQFDPDKRMTLDEIKKSPWLKGDTPSESEV